MYKISTKGCLSKPDSFVNMLKRSGVNAVKGDNEIIFPDIDGKEFLNKEKKEVFDLDFSDWNLDFNYSDFMNVVPCALYVDKEISFSTLYMLEEVQLVLDFLNLTLIDIDTHSDDYVFFVSKIESESPLEHLKEAIKGTKLKISDKITTKPAEIDGKLSIYQILRIINENLKEETANIYLLKDLLEDLAPESMYEIIEPEDGSQPYIKEIKNEDENDD